MGSTAVDDPVDPRAGLSPGAPVSRPRPSDDSPSINWSGRPADDDGSDGDEGTGVAGAGGGASGRRRLAALAGIVSFLYIGWIVVDLVILQSSGLTYTNVHEALRELAPRLVLAVAWLALLYHGLDGLRVVVTDFAPGLRPRQRALRGAVGFAVFAIWIPTTLVLLWPAIRGWFAS